MTTVRNMLAASALTALSAAAALLPAASAQAATSQFPPGLTPFTIQTAGLCAQRLSVAGVPGYSIHFVACNPTDASQQWVRIQFDPQAPGFVYGAGGLGGGSCVTAAGSTTYPAFCTAVTGERAVAALSWTQEADGEVHNNAATPRYWTVLGGGNGGNTILSSSTDGGAAFDLVPVG